MRGFRKDDADWSSDSAGTSLFLFAFGLAVLAFLMFIERHEGMTLQPAAAGTPATLSQASQAVTAAR